MRNILPKGINRKLLLSFSVAIAVSFICGFWVSRLFSGPSASPQVDPKTTHADHEEGATIWTCSMDPQVKLSEPGKCPICGMDLIPLTEKGSEPVGPKTVVLSERAKSLARIRTTAVKKRSSQAPILRLLGRIEPNETSHKNITAWIGGRIDRLHVKVTGQRVYKGQAIATLYSPEIFAAHQDLIVAKKQIARMANSSDSSKLAASRSQAAARNRLRLLGVPDQEIEKMELAESPNTSIAIRTPFGGTVMERIATEGAYIKTGALLYRVADLSQLWVQLDAYESDLPKIKLGQDVDIRVEGISEETFKGKVAFIDPALDRKSRTARVRVAVKNAAGRLRPGMFAEADLKSAEIDSTDPGLVVPSTAPLFTGRRAIVFVEIPNSASPTYKARTVRLGPRIGDEYPVVAGLSLGERVVTKGAFALDADLQIRGGQSMMTEPDDTQPGAWDNIIIITKKDRKQLAPLLTAYLEIQKALAADDFPGARKAAKLLLKNSHKASISGSPAAIEFWKKNKQTLEQHTAHIKNSKSIEVARGMFEPLSNAIIQLLRRLGNPLDQPLRLAFCPMAFGSKGAEWIQAGDVIDNSYFGAAMRTCGEIRVKLEPGSYLPSEKKAVVQKAPAKTGGHQH
jgi:membrane fusion protein, copper/silver efflux system